MDDLNVDSISHIYHGYGDGDWRSLLYCIFTGATITLCVILSIMNPRLIPYGLCATLPDWEHPARYLRNKQGYWIHNMNFFWHPVLRSQWGMLVWAVVAVMLLYIVWR